MNTVAYLWAWRTDGLNLVAEIIEQLENMNFDFLDTQNYLAYVQLLSLNAKPGEMNHL